MAAAAVGDDVYGEDPTAATEELAQMMGKEAAFVTSAQWATLWRFWRFAVAVMAPLWHAGVHICMRLVGFQRCGVNTIPNQQDGSSLKSS